ncbi:MAG TPA: helix-turn-helix domain-containing protein [Longimicrobiales bacterium]|nr:helix-turn-helix domain-containing protein [Longimicrobiales bacterium]
MDQRRYLYHARINSHLTLEQIGIRTALSPTVLRNLDEGRFELLPSGVYARSYVRTFAVAVGLDPDAALAELEPFLPGAPDPLPALNARRGIGSDWPAQLVVHWLSAITLRATTRRPKAAARSSPLQRRWRDAFHRIPPTITSHVNRMRAAELKLRDGVVLRYLEEAMRRFGSVLMARITRVRALSENDLTARLVARFAAVNRGFNSASGRAIERIQASPGLSRFGAAAIDAVLLLIVDAFLVLLISWSSGIRIELLLRDAGWALGAFCAIPIALYFVLFGGIAGSTLGRYICSLLAPLGRPDLDDARADHPLTLPDILRRAVRR